MRPEVDGESSSGCAGGVDAARAVTSRGLVLTGRWVTGREGGGRRGWFVRGAPTRDARIRRCRTADGVVHRAFHARATAAMTAPGSVASDVKSNVKFRTSSLGLRGYLVLEALGAGKRYNR